MCTRASIQRYFIVCTCIHWPHVYYINTLCACVCVCHVVLCVSGGVTVDPHAGGEDSGQLQPSLSLSNIQLC